MKVVSFLQTDTRWKGVPYNVPGESATIGGSGCGPTCMAMVISTLTGKNVTPVDTCRWSMQHGYKAKGQGTYYSYFRPQGAAYGIDVKQLNSANIYHNPNSPHHQTALNHLKSGGMVIACMGAGSWTRGGHYILLHSINSDGTININDPASTKPNRVRGNWTVLKNEVKYYFLIAAKASPNVAAPKKDKKQLVAEKFGLAGETIEHLAAYEYADSLFDKLLGGTKGLSLHRDTILYILSYGYGAELLKKICK